MIVESSPGELDGEFDFSNERELIRSSCNLKNFTSLRNPTFEELNTGTAKLQPDVIHVSAIDPRLAFEHLSASGYFGQKPGGPEESERPSRHSEWNQDGIVFKAIGPEPLEVKRADDVATAICAGITRPRLVGYNVWYSASRIAALSVAKGADAAMGFQTIFDDSLAELFFASLYQKWRLEGWADLLGAFRFAWNELRSQSKSLTGTGVVLWSSRSLLRPAAPAARPRAAAARARKFIEAIEARDRLEVTVKPVPRLNYSLLHNNEPVFETFIIRKRFDETLRDVDVEVELFVGADSYPFRKTFDLNKQLHDLADDIRLPLTSALARGVDENLQTAPGRGFRAAT